MKPLLTITSRPLESERVLKLERAKEIIFALEKELDALITDIHNDSLHQFSQEAIKLAGFYASIGFTNVTDQIGNILNDISRREGDKAEREGQTRAWELEETARDGYEKYIACNGGTH
jgi:hypothetical protein